MKPSYTIHEDRLIDSTIDSHMEIITDGVRRAVGGVESIVLAGGFGRGEGSVRRYSDGTYLPMNDYDLFVFIDGNVPFNIYKCMTRRLHERIGVDIDLKFIPIARVKHLIPDLWTFELKTASRVIWGDDFRAEIDVTKEDIPLSAGLNALFIRTVGLINPQCFDALSLVKGFFGLNNTLMEYEASKTFLEICTALCLLGGFYAPSYRQRACLLRQHYLKVFPELSQVLPSLPENVELYTEYKLTALESGCFDTVALWQKARKELEIVMSFFICRVFSLLFKPDLKLADLLLARRRQLARFYFRPYVQYAFKRVHVPTWPFLMKAATLAVPLYENFRYMKICHDVIGGVHPIPLLTFRSPLIDTYISLTFVLLAIRNDSLFDRTYMQNAYDIISSMFPCSPLRDEDFSSLSGWRVVRDAAAQTFKMYGSSATAVTF